MIFQILNLLPVTLIHQPKLIFLMQARYKLLPHSIQFLSVITQRRLILQFRKDAELPFEGKLPLARLLQLCVEDFIGGLQDDVFVAVILLLGHGLSLLITIRVVIIRNIVIVSMLNYTNTTLLRRLVAVFPDLQRHELKGQNGRVAVVGGSFQFTGAPYYTAISALKVGGDLSHIFCSKFSSPAIKSYSPEIITHPVFVSRQELVCSQQEEEVMVEHWRNKLISWEKAIHSWVIGPGLGRDQYMQKFFPKLVKSLPNGCNVIFDADGIYYLCQHPQLFKELPRFKAIVTPNSRELAYLQKHFNIPRDELLDMCSNKNGVEEIQGDWSSLPFSVVVKGKWDVIITKNRSFVVGVEGGSKRCGGIGDIVAGVASVCSLWDCEYGLPLASVIVREATKMAFEREGRGLTAPCVIEYLSKSVKRIQSFV